MRTSVLTKLLKWLKEFELEKELPVWQPWKCRTDLTAALELRTQEQSTATVIQIHNHESRRNHCIASMQHCTANHGQHKKKKYMSGAGHPPWVCLCSHLVLCLRCCGCTLLPWGFCISWLCNKCCIISKKKKKKYKDWRSKMVFMWRLQLCI